MIKLLVFDMDGTIIDSDEVLIKTREELYSLYKKNGEIFDKNLIKDISGPPLSYAIDINFPEEDKEFIRKEYRIRANKYYDTDLKLFPNVKEVLTSLKNEGIILSVFTSKTLERTKYCLNKYDILDLFSEFCCCDNFPSKPNIDALIYLKNKYKLKEEEIKMVGDTYIDYLAAKNANIEALILTHVERNHLEKIENPIFIKDFLSLKKYVERINKNEK